ncbi:hypothetical protein ACFOTA_16035 [Chitinophaga sp. GCM10012297]|uniref:Uncharacterized protein n=1 Tax=Chitinophaga chungangae TaxID=2821488 RepID=A0ABS3YI22_9BACT|nr:hypothetical protein [Chitinophaga chungangae]MBO9153729.1 hypothetical protein [Chitinophaga chungangae]
MAELKKQPATTEPAGSMEKMCESYDLILNNLQEFDPFSASQILCNVINEHIKRLTSVIRHHNEIAEAAEKSMEALADGLRRLRMQAQKVVDDNHNNVIRLSPEERDPVYTEES